MSLESIEIANNPVTAWETYHKSLYPKGVGRSAGFLSLDRERVADGNCGRLRFMMPGSKPELQSFFEYGLGRDVKVYNDRGEIDYQGFVFDMTLNTGIHMLKKSMQHIYNEVWARYDATGGVNPTQRSTVLSDAESQARFGVIEKVLQGGQQSGLFAINRASETRLTWFAWPMINPDFGAGRGDPHIEITAVGYQHTLNWRTYNQTALVGDADLSVVAAAVLTACGDFIASTSIITNVMQVPREYDTDQNAFDILKSLAAMGDSAGQRWLSRVEIGRIYSLGPTARIK